MTFEEFYAEVEARVDSILSGRKLQFQLDAESKAWTRGSVTVRIGQSDSDVLVVASRTASGRSSDGGATETPHQMRLEEIDSVVGEIVNYLDDPLSDS